jgi:methionine-gamma-lyase
MNRSLGFESLCIKDALAENLHAHVPPIYATSTFVYEDLDKAIGFFSGENEAYVYSRLGNPTCQLVADKIAALEAFGITTEDGKQVYAQGYLFSSGMAAIAAAIMSSLKAGDKVVTQGNLYGTTNELLQGMLSQYGVQTIIADFNDLEHLENTILNDEAIKVMYIETPTNPTIECYDLDALAAIAENFGVTTIADNTFATPYLQQPLRFGIDIVVHSSTKFLNGHGTGISGVAVGIDPAKMKAVRRFQKLLGGNASPFEAYLLNNGVKTLPLRMDKHQHNAQALAEMLKQHPKVNMVNYPGLPAHPAHQLAKEQMYGNGGMLSFEIAGDAAAALRFMRRMRFCTLTATLGTADTLVSHPVTTSHSNVPKEQREAYGITEGLIRVSIGLEYIQDIICDFGQALDAV